MLPLVDKSLEWCASRYDSDGLFLCHKVRTLTSLKNGATALVTLVVVKNEAETAGSKRVRGDVLCLRNRCRARAARAPTAAAPVSLKH